MERAKARLEEAGEKAAPTLEHAIEAARETAVRLGELGRDEADRVATYLRRDLHEAARYLDDTGKDIRTWLYIDLELIEARLLDLITGVADKTRVELAQWSERATRDYRTGEVTAPGALACAQCGKHLHFSRIAHIPPCPQCHGTVFSRVNA